MSFCDRIDEYIFFKGTKIITRAGTDAGLRQWDERNKQLIFERSVPFTDCISKIKNAQVTNSWCQCTIL